ncbi:MAG: ABC transporter permease [Actinomycetia bacterium]|nr:ABC transporter permease [Actinomycetes bacterium]
MMTRIAALAWLNILQLLRNPGEVVGVIVLPLALTMLFGAAFAQGADKPMQVLFVDEDSTAYSKRVGELIDSEESLETVRVTLSDATDRIAEGDASVAIVIPASFGDGLRGDGAEIHVLRNPASESSLAVVSIVQGVATRVSGNAEAARIIVRSSTQEATAAFDAAYADVDLRWEPKPPVYTEETVVAPSQVRGDSVMAEGTTLSSIGFTVWFILFMTFGCAGGILEEREQGTLRRLLVAPVSRVTVMAGKITGIALAAATQAAILVCVGWLAFGVPWNRDPVAVFLVLGSYVLAATGLAVMVSALVRSRDQMSGASPLISTGLAMLGGCLWPIEVVSPFMRTVAAFTPTGWAVGGLTDIVARNQGIGAAVTPSLILLTIAAVTMAIGARVLKFE